MVTCFLHGMLTLFISAVKHHSITLSLHFCSSLSHRSQLNPASCSSTRFSRHGVFQMDLTMSFSTQKSLTTSCYLYKEHYVNVLRVLPGWTLRASPSYYTQNTAVLFTLWPPVTLSSSLFLDHAIPSLSSGPDRWCPLPDTPSPHSPLENTTPPFRS